MTSRVLRWLATVFAATVLLAWTAAGPAGAATRASAGVPVPEGFVGVNVNGPMVDPADHVNLAHQFQLMVADGVQSIRVDFDWAAAQPYPTAAAARAAGAHGLVAGAGGVPTDFSATDQLVALAAQRHLTLLPVVMFAPHWDAGMNPSGGLQPPARTAPYANFLTTLIERYGPKGSFWASHPTIPREPLRSWQIWNEPNINAFWPQPFLTSYVAVLRAAHTAIKRADPGAKVVLASLTNYAWASLEQIGHVRGALSDFGVISVNGFTSVPSNVIRYLDYMHRAAVSLGIGTRPLLATEFSWPSARPESPNDFDWTTTEAGQARNIAAVLPLLAAARSRLHLAGFDYFTWMGDEYKDADPFNFAGLFKFSSGRVSAKPAAAAFKRAALAIEGCRRKGSVATACLH